MLQLGRSRRAGVALSDEERSRHLHIVGASGTGKSKLLEHMLRQDILARRGLCLIDPHGSLADSVVAWCASRGLASRLRIIEPGQGGWSAGFNPLKLDEGVEPTVRIDAMVAACAQVWGGEDMASTPRLKKTLRSVFYALAVRNLTLAEAPLLTTGTHAEVRRRLTEGLPDQVFSTSWGDLNGLSRREFTEVFESTNNRLSEFLTSPLVRRIVGQSASTFDARRAMDDGEIVIVNLHPGTGLSSDNMRLIGTLLTSEFRLCAMQRDTAYAERHPFTLYIDECHEFLTKDIVDMLDQTRKFGLHLVLSHQRLGQLGDRKSNMFNGVMTGGQTKIVFGGLADEDAEYMVREVYRSSFNLERPKHVLDKRAAVGEEPFWLESESESRGDSSTSSTAYTSSSGMSEGRSEGSSETLDPKGQQTGAGLSGSRTSGSSSSESSAYGYSESSSWNRTNGRVQTLKSVWEDTTTSVHSLDEEMHRAIVKLRELPRQVAIVKRRGRPPVRFRPEDVTPPLVSVPRVAEFGDRVREATPYVASAEQADCEIAARSGQWTTGQRPPSPASDDPFWNE